MKDTKPTITIQGLRQTGWKVAVHRLDMDMEGRRPVLRIIVTNPEGQHAEGFAYTNPKDNFNRKIGNQIALGRALKNLQEGNFIEFTPPAPKQTN